MGVQPDLRPLLLRRRRPADAQPPQVLARRETPLQDRNKLSQRKIAGAGRLQRSQKIARGVPQGEQISAQNHQHPGHRDSWDEDRERGGDRGINRNRVQRLGHLHPCLQQLTLPERPAEERERPDQEDQGSVRNRSQRG